MSVMRNDREKSHTITAGVRLASLIAVFCILASLAIVREGRFFGHDLRAPEKAESSASVSTSVSTAGDGRQVINTTEAGKDIIGFNGPVPLQIYISEGKVDSVTALPNQETPSFFERAKVLLHSWDGLSIEDAASKQVDAVSGATFSSKAITGNFKAGIALAEDRADVPAAESEPEGLTIEYTLALLVALSAAITPLFIKNRAYRLVQQLLNVGVLGFWTGTFLDYSVFIRSFANGIPFTLASLLTILLFAVAFIYPLFGRTGHYCAWVCPLGSLQELASRLHLPKFHISPATVKALTIFRNVLWCILILCLWTGLLSSWIDYELFSAFIVKSASTVVLITGGVFLLLSLVIMRPFCRFVCPVGTLLNHAEGKL